MIRLRADDSYPRCCTVGNCIFAYFSLPQWLLCLEFDICHINSSRFYFWYSDDDHFQESNPRLYVNITTKKEIFHLVSMQNNEDMTRSLINTYACWSTLTSVSWFYLRYDWCGMKMFLVFLDFLVNMMQYVKITRNWGDNAIESELFAGFNDNK